MIRSVFTASKNTHTIPLPDNFIGKQIEIIAFIIDEDKDAVQNHPKEVTFQAVELDTRGFKFNRDAANER